MRGLLVGDKHKTEGGEGSLPLHQPKLWTLHHLLSKPSTAASPSPSITESITESITRGRMVSAQEQDDAKDPFICSNGDAFLCQAQIEPVCPKSALWMNYSIQTAGSPRQKQTSFRWELSGNTCGFPGMVVTVALFIANHTARTTQTLRS